MKNSFTILHIMKNILNNVKKIFEKNRGIGTTLELFFY
jgi:hypothetical protein